MNHSANQTASDIATAPDGLIESLAEEYADHPEIVELLHCMTGQSESEACLPDEGEGRLIAFEILKRLLNMPNPSHSTLRAAVFLATAICSSYFLQLLEYWSLDQELEQVIKQLGGAEQCMKTKIEKYKRRVGGGKSGETRRQKRADDIESAAKALNELCDSKNVLSSTLDDIARQLRRDGTSMAYVAKGGWPKRLISLTKKAINTRAAELSNSKNSRS